MTGLRRYANRRDANEAEIVAALEKMGCLVKRMDKPVDLLVQFPGSGRQVICEVKTPKGKLTEDQQEMLEKGWHVWVLRDVQDAVNMMNVVKWQEAA